MGVPDRTIDTIAHPIRKEKFSQAYERACEITSTHAPKALSARFWFLHGIAAELSGHPQHAERCYANMRSSAQYSPTREGDFHREAALLFANGYRYERVSYHFNRVLELHAGDKNRIAALTIAEGIVAMQRGDLDKAYTYHCEARRKLLLLGDLADVRWVRQNNLLLLKAAVSKGITRQGRAWIYDAIMQDGSDAHARHHALLIHRAGKPALLMDRLLVH
jgi:hypothetical protein